MPISSDKVVALCRDFEVMVTARRVRDSVWQDVRELVRPATSDFTGYTTPGEVRTNGAYDSTAIDACKELAAGLHTYLTNPAERWFTLGVTGMPVEEYDEDGLAWLEVVSDRIYQEHNRPESGFHTCMHECFLDIGAFGTSCPYQTYSRKSKSLIFRSFPMSDCYFKESAEGRIDSVARRVCWTRRQLEQEFTDLPPKVADEKNMDREYEVIHFVFPRTDRVEYAVNSVNKPYASVWLCKDTKELLYESGYDELCYHPGRWEKLANQVYGEGPATTCLPDILMLNAMERTLIRAGQKQVDPPLMIPDEGYTLPIATSPASIIWREPGVDAIEALRFEGNLPWGEEKAEQKRESIRKCFHSDWLRMEKENKEMTAFEVADRRNEKLALLAPNLGRIQGEQLGPLLARSYRLLHEVGTFPPAPPSLQKRRLRVEYVSPAARAQMAIKANEASRYVQELITIAAVKPEVLDYVDFDMLTKKLAEYRSITRTIMRSSDAVESSRQQRQQVEMMQQVAAAAEPATKALKNVADAQSKGLNVESLI